MAGYFTHLIKSKNGYKNGVTGVIGVTDNDKCYDINSLPVTPARKHGVIQGVTGVTLDTEKMIIGYTGNTTEKRCNRHGVTENTSISAASSVPVTPVTQLNQKNSPYENDVEYYHHLYNERAAIMEYDGGLSRAEAEQQAHKEIAALKNTGGDHYA